MAKKYQSMFSAPHEQLSELAKLLKKSEKAVREMKKSNLQRLRELVQEKGLDSFV